MLLDTSAILEYLCDGPGAALVIGRLEASTTARQTTPMIVFEAATLLSARLGCSLTAARMLVMDFLSALETRIVPIDTETSFSALDAFERYGKTSGHPARLSVGDCFSYAACKAARVPLLYHGGGFSKTDLA